MPWCANLTGNRDMILNHTDSSVVVKGWVKIGLTRASAGKHCQGNVTWCPLFEERRGLEVPVLESRYAGRAANISI